MKLQRSSLPKLILFDLDGTLLDSSKGIFSSIRHAFLAHDIPVDFDDQALRNQAGNGVGYLVSKIKNNLSKAQVSAIKKSAFGYYKKHAYDETTAYEGAKELLERLNEKGILWGVITNKTRDLTEAVFPLVPSFETASILICREDLAYHKPHPIGFFHAFKTLNIQAKDALYVGDGLVDMLAAKYALCQSVIAKYGYVSKDVALWPHDASIDSLEQLRQWITYLNV